MSDVINNTILAPSTVRLFGRLLIGAAKALADPTAAGMAQEGDKEGDARKRSNEARERVEAGLKEPGEGGLAAGELGAGGVSQYLGRSLLFGALRGNDLGVAHIFAFTYEGCYKAFHVPALFLVHGAGEPVHVKDEKNVDPARLGLAHLDGTIVFAKDLRFWIYDRADLAVRLDITSGAIQTLVIDAETGGGHGRRIDLVGQDGSFSARLGQGSY